MRLLVLPLLAVGLVLAATEDAVPHNDAGIRHLLEGRPTQAVQAFEAALQHVPNEVVVKRNLAAGLATMGEQKRRARQTHEAVKLFDRAIALHPERLRYRVLRGRARFETDSEALRHYAREDFSYVLKLAPDHLDALVNLGEIAYLDRRLDEAVDLWSRALSLRPADGDVAGRLAKAEREQKVEASYEQLRARTFLVRYAPEISGETAATVLRLCEEAYGELSRQFNSYPDKIVVTLYTPAQFASATRMHGWVAGLSDGTIRLTVRPRASTRDLKATVYHELTHHLVRAVARRVPVWLHEGLAQRAERKSLASAEARLRRSEPLPHAGELAIRILSQRDPRRVGRFYDLSLAFTFYLHRQYHDTGIIELLKKFGEGADEQTAIREVFGLSRGDLFARWLEQLQAR